MSEKDTVDKKQAVSPRRPLIGSTARDEQMLSSEIVKICCRCDKKELRQMPIAYTDQLQLSFCDDCYMTVRGYKNSRRTAEMTWGETAATQAKGNKTT